MTTAARLRQLLHKSFHGPAWHGPAVAELLADVTAAQAAARPILASHSIWDLVLHLTAWKDELRRRLSGPGRKLPPEEDWPPVSDTSETAWQAARDRLAASQQSLEQAVAGMSDEQLTAPAPRLAEGLEELVHVIIHHDLYHAGQIAIFKTQTAPSARS